VHSTSSRQLRLDGAIACTCSSKQRNGTLTSRIKLRLQNCSVVTPWPTDRIPASSCSVHEVHTTSLGDILVIRGEEQGHSHTIGWRVFVDSLPLMNCTVSRKVPSSVPRVRRSTSRATALRSRPVDVLTAHASRIFDIPSSADAAVRQSIDAIKSAYQSGVARQRIDVLLPLVGATDLDDWWVTQRSWRDWTLPCLVTLRLPSQLYMLHERFP
jgi:hypothetical protein